MQQSNTVPNITVKHRGCVAIRNGHERMNGLCKRAKFCRSRIIVRRTEDGQIMHVDQNPSKKKLTLMSVESTSDVE